MFNAKTLASLIAVSLLAGCASFGPLGTADFEPTVRRDVPSIEGKLLYQAPATLWVGIDGYAFVDNIAARSPLFGGDRRIVRQGIVVLTEQKLYFVKWFGEKYQYHWDADYKDITSLEIRSFGAGRRLVMKLQGAPSVASLDISGDLGQMIDPQRTITVCQLLAQRSGKGCKTPN